MSDISNPNDSLSYRIHVKGKLEEDWEEWFDGCHTEESNGDTIFILPVKDQAELHGFLDRIRDLGLEIIQIMKVQ